MIIGSDKKYKVGDFLQTIEKEYHFNDNTGSPVKENQPLLILREATCEEWLLEHSQWGNICPASWTHYHYEVTTD